MALKGSRNRVFLVLCVAASGATGFRVNRRQQNKRQATEAVHVTRLHRHDHSGIPALLEAEARWQQELGEDSTSTEDLSLRLSPRQVKWLQEHQNEALVQLGTDSQEAESLVQLGSESHVEQNQNLRLASQKTQLSYRAERTTGGMITTRISNLNSEYVGPVGIGTVSMPKNCQSADGQALVYMSRVASTSEQAQTCHAADQAQVWMVFDTGSTNIWVSSDLCQDGACVKPGRNRYNHSLSQTYAAPEAPTQLEVHFGTGSLKGPQAVDDFHIGPFTVHNQTFAMIEDMDGYVFNTLPFEGILGLAFPAMSAHGAKPFFDNVVAQKAVQQNMFAFYFSLDNPSANAVFWGGVDSNFHDGAIEYFKVTEPWYWALDLKSFKIGDREFLAAGRSEAKGEGSGSAAAPKEQNEAVKIPKAVVDSGTTFITAGRDLFHQIMAKLPRARCSQMTDKTHPPLSFQLENEEGEPRDFVLKSHEYMTKEGNDMCGPAFMQIDFIPGMILGEIFMRRFLTVFDRGDGSPEKARVGFARAVHGQPTTRRLKALTKGQPAFDPEREES